jgi:hypothetical protein
MTNGWVLGTATRCCTAYRRFLTEPPPSSAGRRCEVYEDDAGMVFKPVQAFFKRHAATVEFVHRVGAAGVVVA